MFGLLCVTALAACLLWFAIDAVKGLRRNMKAARESGLEWFIAREFVEIFLIFFLFGVWYRGCFWRV